MVIFPWKGPERTWPRRYCPRTALRGAANNTTLLQQWYHLTPPYAAVSIVFCLNVPFIHPAELALDISFSHCRAAEAMNRISRMPDKHITLCYTSLLPGLPLHTIRPSTHEINVESLKTAFKRNKQETSRSITAEVQRKLCFRSASWLRTADRLTGIPGEQQHNTQNTHS